MTDRLPNPLQTDRKIGLLGDVHGDLDHLLTAIRTFRAHGISTVVALGDVGIVWPGENWNKTLDKISRRLAATGTTLFFLDGNHDPLPLIEAEFPVDSDGLRRLRRNAISIPRGYRATLAPSDSGWPSHVARPGKVLAVLGGANSIDRHLRTEGRDWWAAESITDADLAALGPDRADILLGHDAPLDVPDLDRELRSENAGWPPDGVDYAEQGRRMLHRGFTAVRPELYVGAHFHRHVDQVIDYEAGSGPFRCRVVILDQNRPKTISLAILDTATLQLELLSRGDPRVERLTMRDQGRWVVHTGDADLVFDLDARTVERRPLPGARKSSRADRPLPLLDIRTLHLGAIAVYTVDPLDEQTPYRDQFSTAVVEKIEREDDAD